MCTRKRFCPGRSSRGWAKQPASQQGLANLLRWWFLRLAPRLLTRSSLAAARDERSWCCLALVLALPLLGAELPGRTALEKVLLSAPGAPLPALAPAASAGTLPLKDSDARPALPALATANPEGRYRITPERRALLNTIRFAEGTWTSGRPDGYRMLFGGRLIKDLARHPEITVRRGHVSAAAGAYQFLPGTWHEAAALLELPNFGPASQDQAALYLIEKRGVLGHFDRQGLSDEVLARLAPEWASLPTASGGSYYGQPVHGAQELQRFYATQVARLRTRRANGEELGA